MNDRQLFFYFWQDEVSGLKISIICKLISVGGNPGGVKHQAQRLNLSPAQGV